MIFPLTSVEAFAASWIEIGKNHREEAWGYVEAFAASWIEIINVNMREQLTLSKPLRLRGLKYIFRIAITPTSTVEALAASWIEILFRRAKYSKEIVEALAASWIEMENKPDMYVIF